MYNVYVMNQNEWLHLTPRLRSALMLTGQTEAQGGRWRVGLTYSLSLSYYHYHTVGSTLLSLTNWIVPKYYSAVESIDKDMLKEDKKGPIDWPEVFMLNVKDYN